MTFEENPLNILRVSIYDDKATITARADDLSFAEPDREKIFDAARDILINPRKRLAAEVAYFAQVEIFNVRNIFGELELVDEKFSALNAQELFVKINEAREKSKFPTAQDFAAIETELENIRAEIRGRIQAAVENLPQENYVRFAGELTDRILSKKKFGVVVEDFFVLYSLNMRPFLVNKYEKLRERLEAVKTSTSLKDAFTGKNFKNLEAELKSFCEVVTPLNKFSLAKDADDFPETEAALNLFVNFAIDMYNENTFDFPEANSILIMFEKYFSNLPGINETIKNNIENLQKSSGFLFELFYTFPLFRNIMVTERLPRVARGLICYLLLLLFGFGSLFALIGISKFNSNLAIGIALAFVGFMFFKFRVLTIRLIKNIIYLIVVLIIVLLIREFLH